MDDFVAKEFPFIVTRVNAISKSLVHRLGDDLVAGKGFSATAKFIRQAYMTTYIHRHRTYVALANLRRQRREALLGVDNGDSPAFGEFEDRLGFNGSFPSEHYLRDIWHKWFSEIPVVRVRRRRSCHGLLSNSATRLCERTKMTVVVSTPSDLCSVPLAMITCQDEERTWTREQYLQRRAQQIDGHVFAGDASFKYAKVIRLSTGPDGKRARPVYGIFTIMNEYDQVG